MTTEERFEAVDNDSHDFDKVQNKRSSRADLHAFLLLDHLFPRPPCQSGIGMVDSAEHDEIWLDVDEKQIDSLTDEHILELVRCGVCYADCCLMMFV